VIVVADTTPISKLTKVGKLNLLRDVFGEIIIPQEVYNEVTAGTHLAATVIRFTDWIVVRAVSNSQKVSALRVAIKLGLGECAAIILAEELGADQLLLDDLDARREALSRNLPVIGTVGTLLLAKEQKLISNVKETLDALIGNGKRISQKLYEEILTAAGE